MKGKDVKRVLDGNLVPVIIANSSLFGETIVQRMFFIPENKVKEMPKSRYVEGDHKFTKHDDEYVKELKEAIPGAIEVDVKKLVLVDL